MEGIAESVLGMEFWSLLKWASAIGAVGLAVFVVLPVRWWLPSESATLQYLSETILHTLDESKRAFNEAKELSSLKPELDAHGVQLYGIVHETLGTNKFRDFFAGELFLDTERRFYGPRHRWMLWSGLIRPSVWMAAHRASKKNITGNLKGEGRLLGGVFVIGPGEQGIMMEHRETQFGDHADLTKVMEAVKKIKKEN